MKFRTSRLLSVLANHADSCRVARGTRHMGHLLRNSMVILAVVLTAAMISDGFGEPSIPVGAGAFKSLDSGISGSQDGALEVPVKALSDALLQGGLSQQQIAEALYYRGLAYRELGKPGQAISDLMNAISIKDGLSKHHLKEALRNRAGARLEAGLTPSETVVPLGYANEEPRLESIPAARLLAPVEAHDERPDQPASSPPNSTLASHAPRPYSVITLAEVYG